MKHQLLSLTATAILSLSAFAEWEPRGMCYVWTSDKKPAEAPDDMLTGVLYDYNRNPKGEFFTYSGIYNAGKTGLARRDLKSAIKTRSTGAKNPTNSPDVHGQFAYTLKELMNGKYSILKRYYKYPYTVATPHIYLAPCTFKSLAAELDGAPAGNTPKAPESDFLPDDEASSGGNKPAKGKAKAYDDHVSWFGVFRGKVTAPKSMTFRFYGAADDAIAVRFNDNLVLETGFFKPELYKGNGIKDKGCDWDYTRQYQKEVVEGVHPDKKGYVVRKLRSTPFCNVAFSGITGGHPIKVKEGEVYPIEIIIGNNGGSTLFYLLTQEVTPGNNAPLQLFRTNEASPSHHPSFKEYSSTHYGEQGPDFAEDSPIWKVVSSKKSKKTTKPSSSISGFKKL